MGNFLVKRCMNIDKDSRSNKRTKSTSLKPDNMGSSMIIDEKMISHVIAL
ncbi:MAG: hypothetical protein U0T36_06235 [Saprospiraceae bacterium]